MRLAAIQTTYHIKNFLAHPLKSLPTLTYSNCFKSQTVFSHHGEIFFPGRNFTLLEEEFPYLKDYKLRVPHISILLDLVERLYYSLL